MKRNFNQAPSLKVATLWRREAAKSTIKGVRNDQQYIFHPQGIANSEAIYQFSQLSNWTKQASDMDESSKFLILSKILRYLKEHPAGKPQNSVSQVA